MSAFSPAAAALEGFRVVRRQPRAVAVWTLLWVGALTLIAVGKVLSGGVRPLAPSGGQRTAEQLLHNFGPLAAVLIPTLLVLWVMTTAAVFRAVLRPHERSWFFFRLGMDEVRLGVMTAVAFVAVPLVGGAPATVLLFLTRPIFAAAPSSAMIVAGVGAVVTVALEVWIGVRLSLIAVETFAERRFHLTAYWPLVRRRFWRLLATYVIVAAEVVLVALVLGWAASTVTAPVSAINHMAENAQLLRRILLLLLAGAATFLAAFVFLAPLILISAAQAFAYRKIVEGTSLQASASDVPG